MKSKYLVAFSVILLIEGVIGLILLFAMSLDLSRGRIVNYQILRILIAIVWGGVLMVLGWGLVRLVRNAQFADRISLGVDQHLIEHRHLFPIQTTLIMVGFFLFECFFLTYLAFPVPVRYFILWLSLACFQAWPILRLAYAPIYRTRLTLVQILHQGWADLLPVQRQVIAILTVIGLIYFLAYAPLNYLRDSATHFFIHPDEEVIYPDVAKVLILQDSFEATVRNVLEGWQWWYGYPYLPISAAVLVIPRLIYGNAFVDQIQLNIFLLRQFVSVLPMVMAMFLCVYLVTRFKSRLASVSLFVFLLLLPGIVKFNLHFWHPDSIILLLIMLTIYCLQRDQLQFKANFYFAAITCAIALAIKLWGAFFFLAVAGYLLAGYFRKTLTFARMVQAGLLFIGVMVATIAITSPSLLAPYVTKGALDTWWLQQNWLLTGYTEADPEGVYKTGLFNWLRFFQWYYMEPYIFFMAFLTLFIGALRGTARYTMRLLLGWCLVTGIFLVYFASMKSNQYMIPLMIPLYTGLFLLPTVASPISDLKLPGFLLRPISKKVLWVILGLALGLQFVLNLNNIATSPAVGLAQFIASLR